MLYHSFPDLQWLKRQAESRFAGGKAWNGDPMPPGGWPNVMLNVKTGGILRDNIPGPLSLFSNVLGKSEVTVGNRTTIVGADHFFISNKGQRYTLEVQSAEIFNIHFAESKLAWMQNDMLADPNEAGQVDFYNKLYPKDETVKALLQPLRVPGKTKLEQEELLTRLIVHLLQVNRGEKLKLVNLKTARVSTREEILRRLHLATDHIYSNYHSDISLDDLSRVSMLSKFHFLRAFQQAFGSSPHKFLNNVRLERAKELLTHSEIGILEVSKAVGISDSSSFSRLFRKETGVYPTVFKAMCI